MILDEVYSYLENQIFLSDHEVISEEPFPDLNPTPQLFTIQQGASPKLKIAPKPALAASPGAPAAAVSTSKLSFKNKSKWNPRKKFSADKIDSCSTLSEFYEETANHSFYTGILGSSAPIIKGRGPESPEVMILSYCPLVEDFQENYAISGQDGITLNKMLQFIKIDPNSCFFTFFYKGKPRQEKIMPSEINLLKTLLAKEIELIKPKVIFGLGEKIGQILLDVEKPFEAHDLAYNDKPYFSTYHPRIMNQKPELKKQAIVHLQTMQQSL